MPIAVPGDPVENERVLKRMAEALVEYNTRKKQPKRVRPYTEKRRKYDRAWYANNPRAKEVKRAYERRKHETDVVYRAKKRVRGMREHYAKYQWAIKWELALPRAVEKALSESRAPALSELSRSSATKAQKPKQNVAYSQASVEKAL